MFNLMPTGQSGGYPRLEKKTEFSLAHRSIAEAMRKIKVTEPRE